MEERNEDEILWIALAELFFLDTDPDEKNFLRVADLLRQSKWSREQTQEILIKYIAPNAGKNLGFLVYPVIGEWAGFDQDRLCDQIKRSKAMRAKRPGWYFLISDWWCKRILRRLGVERLLIEI